MNTRGALARPLTRLPVAVVPVANHTGESELDQYRLLDQPIPYRGKQGIFNVPDDLILGDIVSLNAQHGGG